MFGSKIKIDEELLNRCRKQAEVLGFSSVEEYVSHVLEKELRASGAGGNQSQADEEEVARRLKGLGYIE
ncbi:MAG: hypothetical protein AB1898_26050 [Acidobacteriota bacterium]